MSDEPHQYSIVKRKVPTFYFIGVTTAKSSIMRVFPRWGKELGRPDIAIEGMDLKIHDSAEAYRQAVAQIKYDPRSLGALVTTHKIDLYDAARNMFDHVDDYALLCGEVSSISKRGRRLEGHAKDPISAGLSMDALLGQDYFARTGGDVLCFGAGGSAVATALHLVNKKDRGDRPRRFVVVNRSQNRLDRMKAMIQGLHGDIVFDFICNQDPLRNDSIMANMAEGSVVINATGMGKDTPGSPVTHAGQFPKCAIVWEFNYRGDIAFLHKARAQAEVRQLTIEDGWLYFLHGWTQVISQVLHMDIEGERFDRLAAIARSVR